MGQHYLENQPAPARGWRAAKLDPVTPETQNMPTVSKSPSGAFEGNSAELKETVCMILEQTIKTKKELNRPQADWDARHQTLENSSALRGSPTSPVLQPAPTERQKETSASDGCHRSRVMPCLMKQGKGSCHTLLCEARALLLVGSKRAWMAKGALGKRTEAQACVRRSSISLTNGSCVREYNCGATVV